MATRASIEFDYRQALQQAESVDGIANRLSKLSGTKFGNSMQSVAGSWKGENATKYLAKGSSLQEKMNRTAKSLWTTASTIRIMAKRIYDAEMAALEAAERRDYK